MLTDTIIGLLIDSVAPNGSAGNASATAEDKQKKIRNLEKKLRQINELREKQSRGETLDAGQVSFKPSHVYHLFYSFIFFVHFSAAKTCV